MHPNYDDHHIKGFTHAINKFDGLDHRANVLGMLRGSLAFAPVLERTCDGAFLDVASVASSRGVFGCVLI